jgi:hypothetical protein
VAGLGFRILVGDVAEPVHLAAEVVAAARDPGQAGVMLCQAGSV